MPSRQRVPGAVSPRLQTKEEEAEGRCLPSPRTPRVRGAASSASATASTPPASGWKPRGTSPEKGGEGVQCGSRADDNVIVPAVVLSGEYCYCSGVHKPTRSRIVFSPSNKCVPSTKTDRSLKNPQPTLIFSSTKAIVLAPRSQPDCEFQRTRYRPLSERTRSLASVNSIVPVAKPY